MQQIDALDAEPVLLAHRGQGAYGACRFEPEREVRPHHRVDPVDTADEDVADEVLRRDPRKARRELEYDEDVDTSLFDQRCLAFNGRQQPRLLARGQHLSGVPVERDSDRSHAPLYRAFDGAGKDLPVPQMHAVEEPDRDHARLVNDWERLDAVDDLHGRGAYPSR